MSFELHNLRDDAGLSECGLFRWWLTRTPDGIGSMFSPAQRPPLVVCMLNPSTADASTNDQTVRKLLAFMRAGDHRGLVVVNAYAFRARDPRALRSAADPVGRGNDTVHDMMATLLWREWGTSVPLVVAWGKHCDPARATAVADIWRAHHIPLRSWGKNLDGSPPHPLYLPLNTALQPY